MRPRDDGERRHRERLGVDAERDLDHRLVAGDDDLVDLGRIDAAFGAHLVGELLQRLVRVRPQHVERAVVHHDRRDPRDHVGAEGLLRVQDRLHRLRLAGLEVEQRRDDRRRPEIERDRVAAAARVALLDVDQQVVGEHGGDLPVRARAACRRARARCRAARAARRRPSPRAGARGRTSGRRASPRRARRSASAPPAAGSRGGRRRRAPPSAASAAAAPRSSRSSCVFARHASRQPFFSSSIENARGSTELIGACPEIDLDLALLARAVTAAGRVDRDAVPARGVEDRRAGEDARLLDGAVLADWRKRRRTRSGCGGSSGRSSSALTSSRAACFAR